MKTVSTDKTSVKREIDMQRKSEKGEKVEKL